MSKTGVYIEIGENLADVFKEAIAAAQDNGESIYDVVNILSSRIESMANTAVLNQGEEGEEGEEGESPKTIRIKRPPSTESAY